MAAYSPDDDDFDDDANEYASPDPERRPSKAKRKRSLIEQVKGRVMAPAIALIVVGALGFTMSIVNIVIALVSPPPIVNPNDPPFLQGLQRGQVGPVAVGIQSAFLLVNVVIVAGAVQMLRFQSKAFAITSSIIAMINIGTCCCILGLPVGIWSLIILSQKDVTQAFAASA